jgi:hypothetical protein
MGLHDRPGTWKRHTEEGVIRNDLESKTFTDLVRSSRIQAERYAQTKENAMHVKTFISAHRDYILNANNPISAAKEIARNEPHFIPETIEDLNSQAAYLVALAMELNKPQYNQ